MIEVHIGDCLDVMAEIPDGSVDAIVTDPPYGLGFMGKAWDDLPPGLPWARECLRVLKPGGHLLAFGGTRTWHRLACAIEDAGFEMRDSIAWLYGSGFPKSLDVSKAIDKAAGAERVKVRKTGAASAYSANAGNDRPWMREARENGFIEVDGDAPATEAAQQWQGWGTALKPAFEPVVVARKPLVGTVAANVLAHGTGALNIDGCRIGTEERTYSSSAAPGGNGVRIRDGGDGRDVENARTYAERSKALPPTTVSGRWPANVVLDEAQAAALDQQSGPGVSRKGKPRGAASGEGWGMTATGAEYDDQGGASRFFYVAKAPKSERPVVDGVAHPTVKPLALMRWLVRLVTPPGGTVLDTFAGSGTTVEAAMLEGFGIIAIERGGPPGTPESHYPAMIEQRIRRAIGATS